MKAFVVLAFAAVLVFPALGGTGVALAQGGPVIALSNSFYGNTWRRQMVDAFVEQAETAKAAGLIADYVVLNGDGSVAQQNSQLAELILRGVDAIVINAASETALNSIIGQACNAGITVVAFDSLVTHECAWKVGFDFLGYKADQAEATLELIGHEGNVILVRGVRGSGPDEQMYAAQMGVSRSTRTSTWSPRSSDRRRPRSPSKRSRGSSRACRVSTPCWPRAAATTTGSRAPSSSTAGPTRRTCR
jgi:ribose transport system substrate-binding protein